MNILITGIAGFIGYHVARRLLDDGHEVYGIDNLADKGDLGLKLQRLALLGIGDAALTATNSPISAGSLRFLRLDLCEREGVKTLCLQERFELIIHLAAVAGVAPSKLDPAGFFDNNVLATENVLEAARLSKVQHLFFSSSAVVHGINAHAPMAEEDDVDTPLNMYAGSKRAAEMLCYAYAKTFKLPITVFRFFTAYGPWGRPDSIPMKIARDIVEGNPVTVINDGYLVRDFTYVDDIVDSITTAITTPPFSHFGVPYGLYNIGRGEPVPLLSFIQALETAFCRTSHVQLLPDSPYEHGVATEVYADTSKLEQELAYSPVWDYEEAMPFFADWFRDNYGVSFTM